MKQDNKEMNSGKLRHLAIIMDGNNRWARARNLPLIEGYLEGIKALKNLIQLLVNLEIGYLTVFAFSIENWNRNEEEVKMLMSLVKHYLDQELPNLVESGVKLKIIGEKENLSQDIQNSIEEAEARTIFNTRLALTIALNYGSQQEITKAAKALIQEVTLKKLEIEEIDVQHLSKFLYTANMPDLDLLIRTSGEVRLSNFLLWQAAYAELYFTDTLWPDFGYNDLIEAINCYNKRDRRYGRSNIK